VTGEPRRGREGSDLPILRSPRREGKGFRDKVLVQDANKKMWRVEGMAGSWDQLALELVTLIQQKGTRGLTVGFAHWGNDPRRSIHLRVRYGLGDRAWSYVDIRLERETRDLRLSVMPYDYFPRSKAYRVIEGLAPVLLGLWVSGHGEGGAYTALFLLLLGGWLPIVDAIFRATRDPKDHESEPRTVAVGAVHGAITSLMENHPEVRFVQVEMPT
jgi:hypothetical protein